MNVARSTFVRRGYLLTALAVAVLLVSFSGTAFAQTIGFSTSRGTLQEGASTANDTEDPLKVTITRSGNFDADDGEREDPEDDQSFEDWVDANNVGHLQLELVEYDGDVSDLRIMARSGDGTTATAVTPTANAAGAVFGFRTEAARSDNVATRIELTIENPTEDDEDWNEEKLVLRVVATQSLTDHLDENKLSYRTQEFTVTVTDDERKPTFKFVPPNIQLAKGNIQDVNVLVGLDAGGRIDLPEGGSPSSPMDIRDTLAGLTEMGDDVLLSVSPPDAVGTLIEFVNETGTTTTLEAAGEGRYNLGRIGGEGDVGAVGESYVEDSEGFKLRIKAIDVSGFRDERITLMLMEGRTEASKMAEGGGIEDANPATITILSGEETPTVTFSKESISIDEGDSETVHILADTMQGDEVGSVAVRVRGDADISLEQNGNPVSGSVSFGGNANAELTIISNSDPSLEDGEEKTATVTITDANGAIIGDPREVTVTVVGSTAVPVLPLFAQLLLALFLMVGGARLYRRRQG